MNFNKRIEELKNGSAAEIWAANEIERLREGLRLITCESINAEHIAENILDGLPPYHGTFGKTE